HGPTRPSLRVNRRSTTGNPRDPRLLQDPYAARVRVIEQFTLRQTVEAFREIYHELAAGARPALEDPREPGLRTGRPTGQEPGPTAYDFAGSEAAG
ncbi:hypothetical protein AB0938_38575, partial [Streptomyces sp. NPDC047071]